LGLIGTRILIAVLTSVAGFGLLRRCGSADDRPSIYPLADQFSDLGRCFIFAITRSHHG